MDKLETIKLKEWIEENGQNQNLILCGLRYSLSRSSYQCGDGCEIFGSLIPIMPDRMIGIAWDDCREELARYARTGSGVWRDECDMPHIAKLLHKLDEEMERRGLRKDTTRNEEADSMLDAEENLILGVKKLKDDAIIPTYAHKGDACFDFYQPENFTIPANAKGCMVPLHMAVEIPKGYFLEIFPRSSTGIKTPLRMSHSVGIVDEGYKGELCLIFDNRSDEPYILEKGQRVAQGILRKKYSTKLIEVQELSESDRGANGWGSTGK